MNTESIVIENGQVTIHSAVKNIWLSQHQLADLFGVFVGKVNANIRAILKSEVLDESKVCHQRANGKNSFITVYNLEMITALAFRIKSKKAKQYCRWIVRQISKPVIIWDSSGIDPTLN